MDAISQSFDSVAIKEKGKVQIREISTTTFDEIKTANIFRNVREKVTELYCEESNMSTKEFYILRGDVKEYKNIFRYFEDGATVYLHGYTLSHIYMLLLIFPPLFMLLKLIPFLQNVVLHMSEVSNDKLFVIYLFITLMSMLMYQLLKMILIHVPTRKLEQILSIKIINASQKEKDKKYINIFFCLSVLWIILTFIIG